MFVLISEHISLKKSPTLDNFVQVTIFLVKVNLFKPNPVPWATGSAQSYSSQHNIIHSQRQKLNILLIHTSTVQPGCALLTALSPSNKYSCAQHRICHRQLRCKTKSRAGNIPKGKKRFSQERKKRQEVNLSFPPIFQSKPTGYWWAFSNESRQHDSAEQGGLWKASVQPPAHADSFQWLSRWEG